ncbi:plc-like phosphodiesterase [Fusarium sp. NRRL 52700]|nr:plc-like phosphodiesterase [Fusarium sp. NRRL 52700]
MTWVDNILEQIIPTTVAAAPWSEAKPIQPDPGNYGTDLKPAMCEYHGKVFLTWASAPSPMPASFSWTTWLPSDDGWAAASWEYLGVCRQQAYTSALVVFNDVLYVFIPWNSTITNNTEAGCAIYSYDGSSFNFICDWDSRWSTSISAVVHKDVLHIVGYNQSDDDHFVWAYSEVGTTAITGPAGFSVNRIDQQSSSNPALVVRDGKVRLMFLAHNDDRPVLETTLEMGNPPTWSDTVTLNESGNSGISATSSPTGHHAWICFKTHDGVSNLMCHWQEKKQVWTTNRPLGPGPILYCRNEAALVYSNSWVYAVWNTYTQGHLMYWSRRPMKHMDPGSWMGDLADQNISIAALSIPGTHDSATSAYHSVGELEKRTRCQDMTITQQLDAGIRYFDIRAGYQDVEDRNEGPTVPLIARHGSRDLGLDIEEIFSFFYDWLDKHPTEAIIAQMKAEGDGVNSQYVSNDTNDLIIEKPQYWALGDSIPTLNQIKGKIQLVRRFPRANAYDNTMTPFGIDLTSWPDDTQAGIESTPLNPSSPKVKVWLEDNYKPSSDGATALKNKTGFIKDFVSRAVSSNEPVVIPTIPITWYIGFSSYTTSGLVPDSNFNYATQSLGGQTPMNKALEILIKSQGGYNNPKVVGTLVMDYPNWKSGTLIESIIYTNKLTLNH